MGISMRKRVAVFSNGWGYEYLQKVGRGIAKSAKAADVDVFAFVGYASYGAPDGANASETNIYRLPDLNDFDGVILFGNSFNTQEERDYLVQQLRLTGIAAVSLERHVEGADYIGADGYTGMYELVEHLVTEHAVREVLYIGGIEEHPDSILRRRALEEVLTKYGACLDEENVLYGNWESNMTKAVLSDWYEQHQKLPDAIVCANDIMAMAACDWAEGQSLSVPEDIKITGYDGLRAAREHQPSITSVYAEWEKMGSAAMEHLLKRMAGEHVQKEELVSNRLLVGESCGCAEEEPVPTKGNNSKKSGKEVIDGFLSDQHFRHMYSATRKIDEAQHLNWSLSYFFQKMGWMEKNNLMLCVKPEFFRYTEDDDSMAEKDGFPEQMEMICCVHDDVTENCQMVETKSSVFRISNQSDKANIYIFVPICADEKTYGYAAMGRDFEIAQNSVLYIWTRHLNQYMEQVRSNVILAELTNRLKKMSITDGLTGLYNRMGCQNVVYPFIEQCQKEGRRSAFILADIDDMKRINDDFGHNEGDRALCMVADALRENLPKSFYIIRFGGDEFLAAGDVADIEPFDVVLPRIMKQLAERSGKNKDSFDLSISMGAVVLERGEKFDISSVIQRADKSMYEIKREHHKRTRPE